MNIHGQTGFLSKVGDIEDMAKNSITILSDENKLLEFKKNALNHAEKFDIQKILPIYEEYYEEILAATVAG